MEESKSIKDALSGLKIKTRQDLEAVINFLRNQGFGYISDWELHNKKLQSIASDANKFGVDKKIELHGDNYEEEEKKAADFYSQFSSNDKINEYINKFRLSSDDDGRVPSSHIDNKELIAWYEFRKKFGLKDIYRQWDRVTFFNFDKKFIKIYFGTHNDYEFKRFYKLLFNEECNNFEAPTDWNDKGTGIWQDLGKLEIKIYKNYYCDVRGEGLPKLKEIYFKHRNNEDSNILMYNGKMTYTEPSKERD